MNKDIHPTDTVGYNYLSLPMVAASKGIQTILHICKQDVERITPLNSKHGIFSLIVTFAITVLDTIAALQMGWFKWHNYWASREPPAFALSYMRGWNSNIFKDIFYFLQYHCASDNDNHVLFNIDEMKPRLSWVLKEEIYCNNIAIYIYIISTNNRTLNMLWCAWYYVKRKRHIFFL